MRHIPHLEGPLCSLRRALARCAEVLRTPVVLNARGGQRDRVPRVVPIDARYAGRDPFLAWIRSTPVVPAWYYARVVGACHAQPKQRRPERRTRRCSETALAATFGLRLRRARRYRCQAIA